MKKKNISPSLVLHPLLLLLLPFFAFNSLALKFSPQLLSLLSLKTSLSGPPSAFQDWKVPVNGQNDAVWCSWSGVVCDNVTAQVISLDLSHRNLSGRIPIQIRYLSSLLYLNLSGNSLEGSFPTSIFDLTKLTTLDISRNSFDSSFPPGISKLKFLKVFNAFSNNFEGELPKSLTRCESLWRFRSQNNRLNGTIPIGFGSLRNLTFVDLSNNRFTDQIPADFATAPVLQYLNLSTNSFHRKLPENIWKAPNLQIFSASFSNLIGEIPNYVGCKSFYRIELQGNSLNGTIPWDIGHCEKLLCLNLSQNHLNGIIPWEISTLPSIADVDLSHNLLTGTIPSDFGSSKTITTFNVSYNQLIGPIPSGSFAHLNPSFFSSNEGLCGDLVGKPCNSDRFNAGNADIDGHHKEERPKKTAGAIVWILAAAIGVGFFVLVAATRCFQKSYGNRTMTAAAEWTALYQIAIGVAQGICYLHHDCDPVIVHRDLKPSNILLDADFEARVADFGVAKLIQTDESMSVVAGSYGYIAPEYAYTLQVDKKSDIYSYGVILLEIITGKRSVEPEFGEGNSIVDWVRSKLKTKEDVEEVLDKSMGRSCSLIREEMKQMLRIALLCTSRSPTDRPPMRDVLLILQEAKPKRKTVGDNVIVVGDVNDVNFEDVCSVDVGHDVKFISLSDSIEFSSSKSTTIFFLTVVRCSASLFRSGFGPPTTSLVWTDLARTVSLGLLKLAPRLLHDRSDGVIEPVDEDDPGKNFKV
ncbi:unnamed protein product [Arabidopsis thaliana]|uniref:(thale cress) hypothetical protein n=1 Tax=Arabidopsis thaliana TaxID=3702 RepID=A0A7G2FIS5_ARATH|nr:unnamed protein product [Arabidopsis thaliana]